MKEEREPYAVIRARHYANVFEGESGEFVLQDLLRESGLYGDSFDKDTNVLAHLSGKRAIACYIIQTLQLSEMQVYAKTKIDSVLNEEFKKSKDFSDYNVSEDDAYSSAVFNDNQGSV